MPRISERQRHLLRGLRREPFATTAELAAFAGCAPGEALLSLFRLRRRGRVLRVGGSWRLA